MNNLSPVITVEAVEPCLDFWTERLGCEVTVTVPHGDALGFAIVEKGGVQIMYQSRASMADDLPSLAEEAVGHHAVLFIEVDEIDSLEEAMEGVEVVMPRRTTFYGKDEIFVRAPCGTVVGLAAPSE